MKYPVKNKLRSKPALSNVAVMTFCITSLFISFQVHAKPGIETVAVKNKLATQIEAKALFDWAMVYLKVNGRPAAYQAFNQADGKFTDRDLYLFCLDYDKTWKVMGAKPELVGQSAAGRKDLNGKDFVAEFIQIAKTKGSGTSSYTYKNPVTGEEHLKTSYIQKVAETEFCGMGYYNN